MNYLLLSLLALVTSSERSHAMQTVQVAPKILNIEFLYLDQSTCTRCVDTGARLEEALKLLEPVLKELGYEIRLRKIHVTSAAQAVALEFASSPTVRVQGKDIQLLSRESSCSDCGKICNASDITCREWRYGDDWFTSPPRALFVDAILRAIHAPLASPRAPNSCCAQKPPFELPANLKRFFAAQQALASTSPCCSAPPSQKTVCCERSAVSSKANCCDAGCCETSTVTPRSEACDADR